MSHEDTRHAVARKRVVLQPPRGFDPLIRRGVEYAPGGSHTLDLYYPNAAEAVRPGVIFVSGLSDEGARTVLGCRMSEMESVRDWATLAAAAGLVGVTYATGVDTIADAGAVLRYLRASGRAQGIDPGALALWSCSAHVPAALGLLMDEPAAFRCAVMLYGFMLDLDGSCAVSDAQRTWRFATPAGNRTVDDLPQSVALFIVRAGRDVYPFLNQSIDRFVAHALRCNLPITVHNYPSGEHAFDVNDDSDASREIVAGVLTFLRSSLSDSLDPL